MTTKRTLLAGIALAALALTTAPAGADGLVMFRDQAPSAQELTDLMFPRSPEGNAEAAPVRRTRSIRFTGPSAGPAASPAPAPTVTPVAAAAPAPAEAAPAAAPSRRRQASQTAAAPAPAPRVQVASTDPEAGAAPSGTAVGFNIRFAFNSAELLPDTLPHLDRMGETLRSEQAGGRSVVIVGHTDASGSDEYNLRLSEKRAEAVLAYLADRHGVAPERLRIVGRGEQQPLPGHDPFDGANRRVEFHPGS